MTRDRSFHNSTDESYPNVVIYESIAQTEDNSILHFFQQHPNQSYTPDEVWSALNTNAPLTNYRRAITNLTRRGLLTKTSEKRTGMYGRPCYTWKLYIPPTPTQPEPVVEDNGQTALPLE